MSRGVRWLLVGGVALVVLAGCGRSWFAEREAWRRQAEEACLKSGAVKEGPSVTMLKSINGPGVCGADFPIKVGALGEGASLGYADELRPPGAVPRGGTRAYPANTPFAVNPAYPADTRLPPNPSYGAPSYTPPGGPQPLSLTPPGVDVPAGDAPGSYATPLPSYGVPRGPTRVRTVPAGRDYEPAPLPPETRAAPELEPPRSVVPRAPASAGVPMSPRLATGAAGPAVVTPQATLACPIVSALDRWIAEAVQPAALRWFGVPVAEIRQISAYSCRGMNGQPGARISEHAFGNALDIASFKLADGHVITIKGGWRGTPEEQGFLRDVQGAACDTFTTVLAPGSNAFHYDHIHVDRKSVV